MKKMALFSAALMISAAAVGCKSKPKNETSAAPTAAAAPSSLADRNTAATTTPADLGASSSGLGL